MNKIVVAVLIVTVVSPFLLRGVLGNLLARKGVGIIKNQKYEIGSSNNLQLVSEGDLITSFLIDKYGELTYRLLNMSVSDVSLGDGAYRHKDKVYIKPSKGDLASYLVKTAGDYSFDGKTPGSCKVITLEESDFEKKSDQVNKKYYQSMLQYYDEYLSNISNSLAINNKGYQDSKDELARYTNETDLWIENCRNNFSESDCSSGISTIENNKQGIVDAIKQFSNLIAEQNAQYYQVEGDKSHFLQDKLQHESGKLVSSNLIGFTSENVIYLRLNNETEFIRYLNTYFHELMHCMTWDQGEITLAPFFEEGATEYYSQSLFNTRVTNQYELTYMHELGIFKDLISRVGEDKVKGAYQSKDEDMLCEVLSLVSDEDCDTVKNAGNSVFYAYDPKSTGNKVMVYGSFLKLLNR